MSSCSEAAPHIRSFCVSPETIRLSLHSRLYRFNGTTFQFVDSVNVRAANV